MNNRGRADPREIVKPARVWYQSFVDPNEEGPYITRLQDHLTEYADTHIACRRWSRSNYSDRRLTDAVVRPEEHFYC